MSLTTLGQPNEISLLIFDEFRIDPDLPKFQKEREESDRSGMKMKSQGNINVSNGSWMMSPEDVDEDSMEDRRPRWQMRGGVKNMVFRGKPPWYARLRVWLFGDGTISKNATPQPTLVQFVFDQVLSNPEELALFNERNVALQEMLDGAKAAGQKSLVEQITKEWEVRKFENALFAKGMKRYISEKQLLKFVEGCERGLCLDWVRHFTRPIPKEVIEAKIKCDTDGFFDNYVVLHFDPQDKGTTKKDRDAEAEKKKDPILFGVMRGSRKLYFVGDWKDEFCDLTFQQIVDKLGEPLEIK